MKECLDAKGEGIDVSMEANFKFDNVPLVFDGLIWCDIGQKYVGCKM